MNVKIGHVHLKVRDLERAVAFYSGVLGLDVTEAVAGRYAFLSGGSAHHEVALQEVGPSAPSAPPYGVGLYHTAFEVESGDAFYRALNELTHAGIRFEAVDHGISWAAYFSDPDGNGVELYTDRRNESGGAPLWHGVSRPLPAQR